MASESIIKQLSQPFYKADGTKNERLDKYCSKEVIKISIDGNHFTGYKTYSFFWEKTYAKEPVRSSSGVIENLNSYSTFITPHLQIKFSLMSMEDYRRLYDLILSRNEFVVICYDPLTNAETTNKMYFYPDSLPKLNMIARNILNNGKREKWIELLGVQDYTIEMVGTNSQLGDLVVQYQPNIPSNVSSSLTDIAVNVANGQEILVGTHAETIMNSELIDNTGAKWIFSHWNTLESQTEEEKGVNYSKGSKLFVKDNITLYAQWSSTTTYTLYYNYGLGASKIDEYGNPIGAVPKSPTDTFGELYKSPSPVINFDGKNYNDVYTWKGWYRTPTIASESTAIKSTDQYGVYGNSTIYQIFQPKEFTLTLDSRNGSQTSSTKNAYDTVIAIPIPTKTDAYFIGWYYDTKFTKPFGGRMPPENRTIYAKWSDDKED